MFPHEDSPRTVPSELWGNKISRGDRHLSYGIRYPQAPVPMTIMKHDERYLQKQGYPMKRFMYYLRGILACQWIEKYKTMPPVAFQQLYEDIAEDEKIKEGISELVRIKSSGKEMDMSEVPEYLVNYYHPLAEYYSNLVGKFRPDFKNDGVTERLNNLFYETVTGGVLEQMIVCR